MAAPMRAPPQNIILLTFKGLFSFITSCSGAMAMPGDTHVKDVVPNRPSEEKP
jgi:hypothetical protein